MSQRISILPFTSYPSLFFYLFIEDCVKVKPREYVCSVTILGGYSAFSADLYFA